MKIKQIEGIAVAQANSVRFGRKPMSAHRSLRPFFRNGQAGELSARAAARQIGVSHQTILKWAKRYGHVPENAVCDRVGYCKLSEFHVEYSDKFVLYVVMPDVVMKQHFREHFIFMPMP